MKNLLARLVALAPLVVAGCTTGQDRTGDLPVEHSAQTMLLDANGGNHGTASFRQATDGVVLTVEARGLPPGPKGMHVHAVGDCRGPDFTSAGGHWNPTGYEHGTSNPAGPHMGDLPNLDVDSTGAARLTATISGGRLFDVEHPLLDADGAALVIHGSADDMRTNPSGNSGARISCGIIVRD